MQNSDNLKVINRSVLCDANRIVIKVGSALITDGETGVNVETVNRLAKISSYLLKEGKEVAIVSSGAIAAGMAVMKVDERPQELSELQALAALGQMSLVQEYETCFESFGNHSAQILLTHDDKKNYRRYCNASNTINRLLKMQVVPIINENDVVADDEIRFGDNDCLAALSANLISADVLLIMTDQEGLFTANPRIDSDATLIKNISAMEDSLLKMATTEGGKLGSGGMYTKVLAARQAAIGGTHTVIFDGKNQVGIEEVLAGKDIGTFLYSESGQLSAAEVFETVLL
jgi:glutamate 5-kinase